MGPDSPSLLAIWEVPKKTLTLTYPVKINQGVFFRSTEAMSFLIHWYCSSEVYDQSHQEAAQRIKLKTVEDNNFTLPAQNLVPNRAQLRWLWSEHFLVLWSTKAYPLPELALESMSHKQLHILHLSQEFHILRLFLCNPWTDWLSFELNIHWEAVEFCHN